MGSFARWGYSSDIAPEGDAAGVSYAGRAGMSDPKSVRFDPAPVVAHLRRRHPAKTAECVAAATGISADTARQWLRGASRPGFAHMLALIAAYGPDLLAEAMPLCPAWLDEARRAERRRALDAEFGAIERSRAALAERRTR